MLAKQLLSRLSYNPEGTPIDLAIGYLMVFLDDGDPPDPDIGGLDRFSHQVSQV